MTINPQKIASDLVSTWMSRQIMAELRPIDMMDLRDSIALAIANAVYLTAGEYTDQLRDMQAKLASVYEQMAEFEALDEPGSEARGGPAHEHAA